MRRPHNRRRLPPPPAPPGCDADSVVLSFEVPQDGAGVRLDRFIQRRIPRLSRTRAQAIIRACAFRGDGRRRRPSEIVRAGEVVLLVRQRFVEPEVPRDFGVLLDDGAVFAVDKPPGLPMHPTATYHKNTLSYILRERYGTDGAFPPAIAHRLDRETSGVVLCGRTREVERALKMAFESHHVVKRYQAIVVGEVEADRRVVRMKMAPVRSGLHVLMEVREDDALEAETELQVLERRHGHSLLDLYPRTGRQHQLRVHLAAIGHPIVGDKLYGPEREAPFLEYIETGMTPELERRLGHPRHALHASEVRFSHPITAAVCTVAAPLAPDLRQLWEALTV